ncbi:UDP-N-acetylmuramoyl-L-alanyl-D-glutamate--2,6-diaminopimelate ligase [Nocardioides sp. GXZ039]|uniref:UDP-N-acetylmuramoyl-L-alanyl-D-glutamate--2, 6-diaminopimelate ligase n=1 Tax=Nocardioides sp. GXZ039 TaxID=3136018 RepID=UPI0030F4361F
MNALTSPQASPPPRPRAVTPRTLGEVAQWLGATLTGAEDGAREDRHVTGLTLSSLRVAPGDLYAALQGGRVHGADYLQPAIDSGAVAYLTDADGLAHALHVGVDPRFPALQVDQPRRVLGALAAWLYGDPAVSMQMIGVTGTQGKTTTTRLLEAGLERAGVRAAVVGTVGTRIAGEDIATSLTTPEAPDLHALFGVMREADVAVCAMEVSSHALVMGRVDGVVFDVAVFLNLGRDHLDFHRDLEDYYLAKASLFTADRARVALVNLDDEHGRRLAREVTEASELRLTTFALDDETADWRAVDLSLEREGSTFTVLGPGGLRFAAGVPLPGEFNVANALAAIAAAGEAGQDPAAVAEAIRTSAGVPGRLERVEAGQDFLVVVDYAHKPDAVAAAVETLRPLADAGGGRVIVVLGAGGDRDPGKRPIMAEIAARLADVLVITDDNPRTEAPAEIRAAMLAGVAPEHRDRVVEVGDRRTAIERALGLARTGDVVLIAGKGHETGQEIDGVVHDFDDRDVARGALTR